MEQQAGPVVVETRSLKKSYGAVHAVKGVDFKLRQGEVIGLIGDNGAGKTTFIRMLSGAEQPTGGEILFGDTPVDLKSPRDAMALGVETIHQYNSTVSSMTIAQNIYLGREILTWSIGGFGFLNKSRMRENAEDALAKVGFHLRSPNASVGALSGGQRQGVAIARALQFEAKIMILDEPTNHISVKETNNVLAFTRQLPERGYSGIFISHNLNHVFETCSRIVVMSRGHVVADRLTSEFSVSEIEDLL
ncbi:ATP-binding cassette domain-containing protein [Hoeflea sp.]|uniref:ATP-binding cassette domain-containing protein n=1 Tax=Hoeflea sp. TaxID=1940281 RepID=UPI003B01848D